jgi:hypothetical protein
MEGLMKKISAFLLIALLTACGGGPRYTVQTLPSGRQVKIMAIGQIFFSNDSPALMLKYETDLDLNDKSKLQKEITEIWEMFKFNVEKTNLKNAIISANEKPKGFIITTNKSTNYVFQKGSDGQWKSVTK